MGRWHQALMDQASRHKTPKWTLWHVSIFGKKWEKTEAKKRSIASKQPRIFRPSAQYRLGHGSPVPNYSRMCPQEKWFL